MELTESFLQKDIVIDVRLGNNGFKISIVVILEHPRNDKI